MSLLRLEVGRFVSYGTCTGKGHSNMTVCMVLAVVVLALILVLGLVVVVAVAIFGLQQPSWKSRAAPQEEQVYGTLCRIFIQKTIEG